MHYTTPTRTSVDGFLCLQHSFKDQLWLDQALLFETHVRIEYIARSVGPSPAVRSLLKQNSNRVRAIVSQPW